MAVEKDSSVALFEFLKTLPLSSVSSLVATLLIFLFFVTSADSGALITDYLTAKTEHSPVWQRLFWTAVIAVLSIILLIVGGLSALQSAVIMSALPFTFIMLLLCWGLIKALRLDVLKVQALQSARITPRAIQNPRSWQQRLGLIMHYPHSKAEVTAYIHQNVHQAFQNIKHEFQRRNLDVSIREVDGGLLLKVDHQNEINFIYQVVATETRAPSFMLDDESSLSLKYYKAEVFLKEGGKTTMSWNGHKKIYSRILLINTNATCIF